MHDIFPATAARLEEWKARPEVLGVLLVGSKSRGHNDNLSDDDLEVLLTDEAFMRLAPTECGELLFEGEGELRRTIYDTQFTSFTALKRNQSSSHDLDHWPYERAWVLFDHATIDVSIAANRAEKTRQRGMEAAQRLLIARGAKALARVLFALEWRWVPLDHWLEPELRTLQDPTQSGRHLIEALKTGNPVPLRQALGELEERLVSEGVPGPQGRRDLFFELIHPGRAQERAIHGLY